MRRERVKREVLAAREADIWNLRQQGLTHDRIATELGLERSTVTKALQRLTARTNAQLEDAIIEQRISQVARLDMIVDEALQSWHKSKEADRTVSKRTAQESSLGFKRAPSEEITVQTKNREGEPRYLETARVALADIRKLLALDTPVKQTITLNADQFTALRREAEDLASSIEEEADEWLSTSSPE